MNTLKKIFLLLGVFLVISYKAQVPCNTSNSPTFQLIVSQATLATNGLCGMYINIQNAASLAAPGAPLSFSVIGPGLGAGQPTPGIAMVAGTWTAIVYDNFNGCMTSQTVQVTVLPAPSLSITANQNSVCVNQTIQLTAQGATTYTWNNSKTGSQYTTSAFTSTGNITYSVQLQGASNSGCVAKNNMLLSVLVQECEISTVGIAEYTNANQIKIYPNPVNEILNVKFENTDVEIKIIDLLGKEMLTVKDTKQINVSELPRGLYFIKIGNNVSQFLKQ